MAEAAAESITTVEEKAFEFAAGLYGFPTIKRFLVTDIPGGGDVFQQMIAIDDPDLSFTLVNPCAFFANYVPDLSEADLAEIGAEGTDQVVLMTIANVPKQFREATVNLKAPLIFNPFNRKARQVILAEEQYKTREQLFQS